MLETNKKLHKKYKKHKGENEKLKEKLKEHNERTAMAMEDKDAPEQNEKLKEDIAKTIGKALHEGGVHEVPGFGGHVKVNFHKPPEDKPEEDKELDEFEKELIEQHNKREKFFEKGFEYWKQKRINYWNEYLRGKHTKVGFKRYTKNLGLRLTNLSRLPMKMLQEKCIPEMTKHLEEETEENWERWAN